MTPIVLADGRSYEPLKFKTEEARTIQFRVALDLTDHTVRWELVDQITGARNNPVVVTLVSTAADHSIVEIELAPEDTIVAGPHLLLLTAVDDEDAPVTIPGGVVGVAVTGANRTLTLGYFNQKVSEAVQSALAAVQASATAVLSRAMAEAAALSALVSRNISELAAIRAEALADNTAVTRIFVDRATADDQADTLSSGDVIEVSRDETAGGGRYRYVYDGADFVNGIGLPVLDGTGRVNGTRSLSIGSRGAVADVGTLEAATANRAALLDALDVVEEGAEVHIPEGVHYVIPSPVNGDGLIGLDLGEKRVSLVGPGEIRFLPTVDAFDYIARFRSDDVLVEGVTFSAAGASFGARRGEGLRVDGERVRLRDVTARGTGEAGSSANMFFLRGAYVDAEGCTAFAAGYAGFRMSVSPYGRLVGFKSFEHVLRIGVVDGEGAVRPVVVGAHTAGQAYLDVSREMRIGDILGVGLVVEPSGDLAADAQLYRVRTVADLGGGVWRCGLARAYHPNIDGGDFFLDYPLATVNLAHDVSDGTRINFIEGTVDLKDIYGSSSLTQGNDASAGIVADPEPVILRHLNMDGLTVDGTTGVGVKADFFENAHLSNISVASDITETSSWYAAVFGGGGYDRFLSVHDSEFRGLCYTSRTLRSFLAHNVVFDVRGGDVSKSFFCLGLGAELAELRRCQMLGASGQAIELRDTDRGTDTQRVRAVDTTHEGDDDDVPVFAIRTGEGALTVGRVEEERTMIVRGTLAPSEAEINAIRGASTDPVLSYDSGRIGFAASSESGNVQIAGLDTITSATTMYIAKRLNAYDVTADGVELIASRGLAVGVDTSVTKVLRVTLDFGATAGVIIVQARDGADAILDPATAPTPDVVCDERALLDDTGFGGTYRDGNDVSGLVTLTLRISERTQSVLVIAGKGSAACRLARIAVAGVGAAVACSPTTYTPRAAGLSEQSAIPDVVGFAGQVVLSDVGAGGWRSDGATWTAITTVGGGLLTDLALGDVARALNQATA